MSVKSTLFSSGCLFLCLGMGPQHNAVWRLLAVSFSTIIIRNPLFSVVAALEFVLIGCFKDVNADRDLNSYSKATSSMTTEICVQKCQDLVMLHTLLYLIFSFTIMFHSFGFIIDSFF